MSGEKKGRSNIKRKIFMGIGLVCLAAGLAAAGFTIRQARLREQAQEEFQKLSEQTQIVERQTAAADPLDSETATEESEKEQESSYPASEEEQESLYPTPEELGITVPDKEVDLPTLQEGTNEDIYAWIYIPDTKIDYPVLQNPDELDYYLDTNLDGSKGYPGCIYTQLMNSKDWTDKNTVIYGHNMKDGSMFANLHRYEDSQFFTEHPYVYLYTEDGLLVYQVFAAYEHNDQHILLFNDISTDEKYQAYLDSIFLHDGMNDNFDTGIELDAQDRIITLSTCIGSKADRRFLVQAVLVAEKAAEKAGE